MQDRKIYEEMSSIIGEALITRDVRMKDFTSIKTGGNARFMVAPDTSEKIRLIIKYLSDEQVPYLIIGNSTNLLFPDGGYEGVVIRIGPKLSKVGIKGNTVMSQAGASLASVASKALEESLSGLEFASGIPGTVGGGVAMNAGAYGGEMSQVVAETECITSKGEQIRLMGKDHEFAYRHSRIQAESLIVTVVTMILKMGDRNEIRSKMTEMNARRRDKQPLDMPSAGSVFKRPDGFYTGQLIQECGLKGYTIGGAQVSDKHCGFIVNLGNATSQDVLDLIKYVQKEVYDKKGVLLEPEVKIIGG